ncbi:hypothetical protein Lepto7376_2695 [[Leptolyngbya] sp. PCC 7376]|uniref:hypothetical protein n=1 Tax=[Leptolyngbya] sp. PCC 7376 TaxID=111781 RepID=UPI00029F0B12|nr:hypothetical protein [[Leptolyngbya] sp. PCC 7376]AFY38964.1 hypothetical protein Lepto7376_2695 [[Leptolyngbya] sp. PCC 7376]
MPRIKNAPTFNLESLQGQHVTEILGATNADSEDFIEMLFLNVVGDPQWHRIFLDAGIGFWEKMPKESAFYDYEEHHLIDYAARWNLSGAKIISAKCVGETWNDLTSHSRIFELSYFKLVTDAGILILAYVDPHNMESETVLSFIPDR